MKVKTSRREAKESCYWPDLVEADLCGAERNRLLGEASERIKIFGAITREVRGTMTFDFYIFNFEFVSDFNTRIPNFSP